MNTGFTPKENDTVSQEKKMTAEEDDYLKKEVCFNMCWCGYHKCHENDKQNSFIGVDRVYLRKGIYVKAVKNNFKCEICDFDSIEITDVKNHFMENYRENLPTHK